jgi:MFS superfamily sulfate permease-like transporter
MPVKIFSNLRGDLFGGLTAAVVALPLALASALALPEVLSHPVMEALTLGLISLAIVYFLPKKIGRGLPGAGATMRTVVNVNAGGKTPISGALHAIVLLGIVLGAGGLAKYIPHAVLAGILIKVGTDIIDWDYLKHLRRAPLAGVIMMFTVLGITVFVDLITAVAVGVVMASLIFMKRMAVMPSWWAPTRKRWAC